MAIAVNNTTFAESKERMNMIKIRLFEEADRDEIIALVLSCQNDGTRPAVSVDDQPELLCIREKYFSDGGCFWVATDHGHIIGSIGLMNCGNGIGVLKKFFVNQAYRGEPYHLGRQLYAELLTFAKQHAFQALLLDTPKNTERAHKFYEKAGFVKIFEKDLPVHFDHPYKDCDFFQLTGPFVS